jgi:hypothetical protein
MNGENERTLRDAGLIVGGELDGDTAAFIEGLSEQEVEVVVDLKRRMDDAGIPPVTLEEGFQAQGVVIL